MKKSIAIIGAGICGAVCASQLAARGNEVKVFDKGRGPGGRTSSRRTDSGHRFDHGASHVDVTHPALHQMLAPAVAAGVLRRSGHTYTSPSGMNALCKWLLDGLPTQFAAKTTRLRRDTAWHADDEKGLSYGPFDAVVLAVPPVNAVELVANLDVELAQTISSVRMLPRWVAMLALGERPGRLPDLSMINGHILRRSMSNSVGDALVVEANQEWSVEHVESDPAVVEQLLFEQVRSVLGSTVPVSISAHRWRYAFVEKPLGQPYLRGENHLYICGDWCMGHSIESAWLSGSAVVDSICPI